jgi:tRNA1(Val) A37 N6-methylase TrmN6
MSAPSLTDDQFLNSRVKLRQYSRGHRAGSDAVFLAATIPVELRGLVVDAGSASGAVGLMAAWRAPYARLRLVEFDEDEAILARANIASNGMDDRAVVLVADLFALHRVRVESGLCAGDADLVLSNPPFLEEGAARISPDQDRARAHVMPEGGLEKWILSCLAMLKPNGILTMIHRSDRLDALLHLMQGRFGDLVILPLHAREDEAATRILLSGKRNSRAPLRVLPGLVIHQPDGGFTPRASSVHKGDAAIILR